MISVLYVFSVSSSIVWAFAPQCACTQRIPSGAPWGGVIPHPYYSSLVFSSVTVFRVSSPFLPFLYLPRPLQGAPQGSPSGTLGGLLVLLLMSVALALLATLFSPGPRGPCPFPSFLVALVVFSFLLLSSFDLWPLWPRRCWPVLAPSVSMPSAPSVSVSVCVAHVSSVPVSFSVSLSVSASLPASTRPEGRWPRWIKGIWI